VGLAMSVGAAAGLAHLGVLEVLEADGLPPPATPPPPPRPRSCCTWSRTSPAPRACNGCRAPRSFRHRA
jgi:hypothetical protein